MNFHLRILSTGLLAVLAGCGWSRADEDGGLAGDSARQLDPATPNAGRDPKDKRIVALVSWLKDKGVTLELRKADGGAIEWRVREPKTPADYDVVFIIRSFPASASEEQMRKAINVNLAYVLNAPARLAMSHGGVSGTHPAAKLPKSDDDLPRVNGLPVTKAVEKLFKEYKPG